jgi:hypothetical protein
MEEVADSHIEDLHITTDATTGSINVKADVAGAQSPTTLRVAVLDGEKQLVSLEADSGATLPAKVSNPKLWSPASPQLYDLQVELLDAQGKVLDSLKSYAGIRSVGKTRDADGTLAFYAEWPTHFLLGHARSGLVAGRTAHSSVGRRHVVRYRVPEGGWLQHDSQAHQGRTAPLLHTL